MNEQEILRDATIHYLQEKEKETALCVQNALSYGLSIARTQLIIDVFDHIEKLVMSKVDMEDLGNMRIKTDDFIALKRNLLNQMDGKTWLMVKK